MGTKTADETGAETGAETPTDEQKVSVAKTGEVTETDEVTEAENTSAEDTSADQIADQIYDEDYLPESAQDEDATDVRQGATAIVSAALGLVSLTGSWIGTVAAARENLIGQLETSSDASVAKQVKEIYGDSWQTSALWGGLFALLALVVGVVVLARPAFGAPGKPQAVWIKSVAWSGVALGVIGLLIAILKYTDILLGLPSTS